MAVSSIQPGDRFGRWTALIPIGTVTPWHDDGWHCQCACGTQRVVARRNLTFGKSRSCGCYSRDHPNTRTHGLSRTPVYRLWKRIVNRCTNTNEASYADYGGRGIRIAEYWRHDARIFCEDILTTIGPHPSPRHTLDRIDNDGHYERGNVRWATPIEQGMNKRSNHLVTYDGVTLTLSEWARRTGLHESLLGLRLRRYHWTVERTLTTPSRQRRRRP